MSGALLVAALAYVAAGLAVLPLHTPTPDGCSCRRAGCENVGKHPRTLHGKDDASTDPGVVRHWWCMWPEANVGVRPPAGVVVLDVDPRNGGSEALLGLSRTLGPLTPTWTALTGGGGLHAWLRYGGPTRGRLCEGVDLKGHDGYLVVPPSVHASGAAYRWLTDGPLAPPSPWLRRLLAPPARERPAAGRGSRSTDGLVRAVAGAQKGNRNSLLFWAACSALKDGASDDQLDALMAAARSVGLAQREIERTMASAERTAGAA